MATGSKLKAKAPFVCVLDLVLTTNRKEPVTDVIKDLVVLALLGDCDPHECLCAVDLGMPVMRSISSPWYEKQPYPRFVFPPVHIQQSPDLSTLAKNRLRVAE